MSPSRRDFLKGAGVMLGSVFLPACGSSGGGSGPVGGSLTLFPGGYRFVPLLEVGHALPEGDGTLVGFTGGMVIHDDHEVVFSAENESGQIGMYRAIFDPNPFARNHLLQISKIVREGDVLSDGTTVERLNRFVANRHHSVAAILETNDPTASDPSLALQNRVYIGPEGGPLQRFIDPVTTAPGGNGLLGLNFFDLDIHEDDDLILVAHYTTDDIRPHQGLFFLPGGSIHSGSVLLSTAQFLPDSSGVIAGLGLCDLSGDGHFVVQTNSLTEGSDQIGASVVSGRTTDAGALRLRSAPREVVLSRGVRAQADFATGEAVMGPRVDSNGTVAQVLNVTNEELALFYGGRSLFATSGLDESSALQTMWPPVASETGLVFLLGDTQDGQKLMASDGSVTRVYLSEGDEVEGRTLNDMIFGTMP
ncbi:MAG: twin-arginine translocation signal domain-containing protein, partial [Candidatus Eremiobacteraeota bacterium]|nr:twin-arginine translocation signal domain-containing protein [Candidatus Eremiobacteraeota bacterium]